MKTITVFALLVVFGPATLAAQTATQPTTSSQATVQPPRLQRWFVSAPLRQTPNAKALKAAAEEAVSNCYQSAIDIVALASGDKETSRRNGSYAADRERAGIVAVKAAGGEAVTAQSRFTGVGDEHGRGIEFRCAYPSPGPQGPAGQQGESGYDGISCWDLNENGIADLESEDTNGDGRVDVKDCRGDTTGSDDSDLRFTLGAGVLTDLFGEYNRFNVGLALSPAWQKGAFVLRAHILGTLGNGDKFSRRTVEGLVALVAGGEVGDDLELGAGPGISGVYGHQDDAGVYNREFRFGAVVSLTKRWSMFELAAVAGIVREHNQDTGERGMAFQGMATAGVVFGAE